MPDWVRVSAGNLIPTLAQQSIQVPTGEGVFRLLTGKPYSSATLLDLIAYRFQESRVANGVFDPTNNPNGFL